jgi:hypothetical protein
MNFFKNLIILRDHQFIWYNILLKISDNLYIQIIVQHPDHINNFKVDFVFKVEMGIDFPFVLDLINILRTNINVINFWFT